MNIFEIVVETDEQALSQVDVFSRDNHTSVSYTHLDVYKRQEKQTPDLQFQVGRLYYGAGMQPDSLTITWLIYASLEKPLDSTTNRGAFCFGYFAKFLFFALSMVLWYLYRLF